MIKPQVFNDIYRYYCPVCGAEIDGEYDAHDDTTTCTLCGKVLKVGDGVATAGTDNNGDLIGTLFMVCPKCKTETAEDIARIGEGFFVCSTCGHRAKHIGGLE